MEYFPLILVGGFPDAFPDVTDDQSGRSGGHGFFFTPSPAVQKNPCPPLRPDWSSVTSGMHLEIPQLKSMGNIPFGRFSVTKPQTPNPVILHQFVAA